jgi:NAD+ kinase
MSSTTGSTQRSASAVRRAAIVPHGKPERVADSLGRVQALVRDAGVELVQPDADPDLAIVLGGDGTMLRSLKLFLGHDVPTIGVNYGSVGFLTAIGADELESQLERVLAGDYRVVELRTLEVDVAGRRHVAVNDVVARSATLGRMVELSWTLGGEDLGRVPCDGVIFATPAGSTAYNLSNGGPVLVWGLEAMAVSFLAPHSLHVRPLVVPRGLDVEVGNVTPDVPLTVLVDGHPVAELGSGGNAAVRVGDQASLLATLPEVTFFSRYRQVFTHQ